MRSDRALIVTAEHGGNEVPPEFLERFRGHEALLASHRGWDPGTLDLAERVAMRLGAELFTATVTRLLVDLNRSPHHRDVFSEVTRRCGREERRALLERWHEPHRQRVIDAVALAVSKGRPVVHLGIHSFTPELHGVVRKPDLALLYDPQRGEESKLAAAWARDAAARLPGRTIRRNDPYRGSADGLTRTLRQQHADAWYAGIEVEVNQRHVGAEGRFPDWAFEGVVEPLESLLR